MADDNYISTSRLAKELDIPVAEIFNQLRKMGLLEKADGGDVLTPEGLRRGGKYMESAKFGRWIAWPKNVIKVTSGTVETTFEQATKIRFLTATTLGSAFGIPVMRMNYILSELGWIQKYLKGWTVTQSGIANGGLQKEDSRSGVPYVTWNDSILSNPTLLATIADLKGDETGAPAAEADTAATVNADTNHGKGFRDRFPAKFRSTDGHFVRSRSEMLIDNWLYMAELVHAYERKLPIEEEVYCDFYLPVGKLYIEFWGMEEDAVLL